MKFTVNIKSRKFIVHGMVQFSISQVKMKCTDREVEGRREARKKGKRKEGRTEARKERFKIRTA